MGSLESRALDFRLPGCRHFGQADSSGAWRASADLQHPFRHNLSPEAFSMEML